MGPSHRILQLYASGLAFLPFSKNDRKAKLLHIECYGAMQEHQERILKKRVAKMNINYICCEDEGKNREKEEVEPQVTAAKVTRQKEEERGG